MNHPRAPVTSPRQFVVATAMVTTLILIPTGCSKDDVKSIANTVQQQASNIATQTQQYTQSAVQKVEEVLPDEGSVSLRMEPAIDVDTAQAKIVSLGEGRSVVQISSYDPESAPKTFPSLLLQGPATANDVASLVGQTVACEIYVQQSASSPIWVAPAGKNVRVTFASFDPKKNLLQASIHSSTLVSSDNTSAVLNGGRVIAKFKGGS